MKWNFVSVCVKRQLINRRVKNCPVSPVCRLVVRVLGVSVIIISSWREWPFERVDSVCWWNDVVRSQSMVEKNLGKEKPKEKRKTEKSVDHKNPSEWVWKRTEEGLTVGRLVCRKELTIMKGKCMGDAIIHSSLSSFWGAKMRTERERRWTK